MSTIQSERLDHLMHIELCRPDAENRLTMAMLSALGRAFTEADDDPTIRAVLLTGRGADFCTGADIQDALPAWAVGKNPFDVDQVNPFGVTGRKRRKPFVSVVHGRCMNGGLELALASDICVAASDTRFAFQEIRFGTYPFAGGVFRLIRAAGWSSAMRLILTAEEFGADEAHRLHVVAAVEPIEEARAAGLAIARRVSEAAPLALQAAVAQAQAWADASDLAGFARSVPDILRLLNSRDAAEAYRGMAEGRAPVFTGR